MSNWQKDIMKLGNDFLLPTDKVKEIVTKTAERYPHITDNEYLYDKAWASLKPLLMSI